MSTVNFNDTTPAALSGFSNVHWQSDASGNISANVPLSASVKSVSTDYTATTTDQMIAATAGVSNVYLPAAPVANQILQIRNLNTGTNLITIQGNGNTVAGLPTYPLYSGMTIQLWFDLSVPTWRSLLQTASGWLAWTPTFAAAGSMTVTSPTITDAQWLFINGTVIFYKLSATFTLGGTANSQVYFTAPLPVVGTLYPGICWIQEPAQVVPNSNLYFCRPDLTQGFTLRRADNANFPLGAYTINTQGFYRIA
jgi:hypothetical protein